jgi:lipopolysaccharide export system protein LptA
MRAERQYAWLRFARRAALGGVVLVVAALAVSVVVRRAPRPKPAPPEKLEEAKVDRKEGIEHFEFKGGKGSFRMRAAGSAVGEDGLNRLSGGVEIVYYGKTGGLEVTLTADGATYDKDLRGFMLDGNARVKHKDLVLESASFTYDNDLDVFRTDRGATALSGRLKGSAEVLVYRQAGEELELERNLKLEVKRPGDPGPPVVLEAARAVYRRAARRGEVEGGVRFSRGRSSGSAARAQFVLTPDEQQFENLRLAGEASVTLFQESGGGGPRSVKAEEILVLFAAGTSEPKYVKTSGGFGLELADGPDRKTTVEAAAGTLRFAPGGELTAFSASGAASIGLPGSGGSAGQTMTGGKAFYDRESGVFRIVGREGQPARLETAETSVEAAEILFTTESSNILAKGGVKNVLKPRPEAAAGGLFGRDRPVIVTSGVMRYTGSRKRFSFKGGLRIWQDKESLAAGEMEIAEKSGEVVARGGVKSQFSRRARESEPEERLGIAADTMRYLPGDRKILYNGHGSMTARDLTMTAASIVVSLRPEGGLQVIQAMDEVVVVQGSKEGRGNRGRYDLGAETVVLTGGPILIDREKGTTEGHKLTFHLGDGRITIENKDRDRSLTVIKS